MALFADRARQADAHFLLKRAALSEARKLLRQAHHILAGLGDDALAAA